MIYNIALFQSNTDLLPYFLFEVLSYNNTCQSNQDGSLDNYIKKVLFARDILNIPMLEVGYYENKKPSSVITKAMEKYEILMKIEDPQQYLLELNRSFYESIINRIGKVYFK